MKFSKKLLFAITVLFIIANVFVFIRRNKGFEYVRYSDTDKLYPADPDNSFLKKWNGYNEKFSKTELLQGLSVLNETIGVDTISNEEDKAISIAGWLHTSFYRQLGNPDNSLSNLNPIQQYRYLQIHKERQLWCGHYQAMFGFFCTAAGLQNRYIEITPKKNSPNDSYHEINEVYLPRIKKWMMVDATRNFLSIKKEGQVFSASGYFDYMLNKQISPIFITSVDSHSVFIQQKRAGELFEDKYFNDNHALRYYLSMDLSRVYGIGSKIKRYVFGESWYEMYDPKNHHSNYLFRIRQFLFFGLIAEFLLLVLSIIRNKRLRKI
jgi:hypothetical protein